MFLMEKELTNIQSNLDSNMFQRKSKDPIKNILVNWFIGKDTRTSLEFK